MKEEQGYKTEIERETTFIIKNKMIVLKSEVILHISIDKKSIK